MKKLLLIGFLLNLSFNVCAQGDIMVGADITSRYSKDVNAMNEGKVNQFTYGLGMSVIKFKSPKFFYEVGISYLFKPITSNNEEDFRVSDIGTVELVGLRDRTTRYNYASTAFIFNYKILETEGTNIVASIGLELDWLFRTTLIINSTYDGTTKAYKNGAATTNNINTLIPLSLGLFQPISNNLLLIVKPQFIYRIPKNSEDKFLSPTNHFGLSLQLFYRINNI